MKKKKNWKKEAWDWFSKYIRLLYADESGMCECVTCGKVDHWKKMQAGHFIDSRNNSVLLHEKLVHVQCSGCNLFLSGNKVKYTLFMLKKGYTIDDIEAFEQLKFATCKVSQAEWQEKSEYYKSLVKDLEQKKSHDPIGMWD